MTESVATAMPRGQFGEFDDERDRSPFQRISQIRRCRLSDVPLQAPRVTSDLLGAEIRKRVSVARRTRNGAGECRAIRP
jgi:hypothetical protein